MMNLKDQSFILKDGTECKDILELVRHYVKIEVESCLKKGIRIKNDDDGFFTLTMDTGRTRVKGIHDK